MVATVSNLDLGSLGAHFAEAVAAVNGLVAARPERDHGVSATLCAYDGVHFSRLVRIHAPSLLRASNCAATPAALGLVRKSSSVEKFLFTRREDKFATSLHADEGLVC